MEQKRGRERLGEGEGGCVHQLCAARDSQHTTHAHTHANTHTHDARTTHTHIDTKQSPGWVDAAAHTLCTVLHTAPLHALQPSRALPLPSRALPPPSRALLPLERAAPSGAPTSLHLPLPPSTSLHLSDSLPASSVRALGPGNNPCPRAPRLPSAPPPLPLPPSSALTSLPVCVASSHTSHNALAHVHAHACCSPAESTARLCSLAGELSSVFCAILSQLNFFCSFSCPLPVLAPPSPPHCQSCPLDHHYHSHTGPINQAPCP